MSCKISVAIDGPAGAGKSTVARKVAKTKGYIYVDTGALYRAVAYSCIKAGVSIGDVDLVAEHIKTVKIEIKYIDSEQRVFVNGEDVTGFIRTPEISGKASEVSAIPTVRAFLLDLQRQLAVENDVVMDGRDIGTVVLPNATVKIFLTASAEVRAKRRYDELIEKGQTVEFDDVLSDLQERDYRDSHREVAPLKPSEESVIVDTSLLSFDESVNAILTVISEKI
jgi:cytidylate kinase